MDKGNFLKNLGFSNDFIKLSLNEEKVSQTKNQVVFFKKDNFRKVKSDGNIEKLDEDYCLLKEKRSREYHDIYDNNCFNPLLSDNDNSSLGDIIINENTCLSGNKDINNSFHIDNLIKIQNATKNINNEIENHDKIIKAYRSNLKMKHIQTYLENSRLTEEINKIKIYHKCNYHDCRRTFSSSGWLSSHLEEHLKEINKHSFNAEFELNKNRNNVM